MGPLIHPLRVLSPLVVSVLRVPFSLAGVCCDNGRLCRFGGGE